MDPKVKERWVAALRSGEYEQCWGLLHDLNGRMCCLGVLIDTEEDGEWFLEHYGVWDNQTQLPAVPHAYAYEGGSDVTLTNEQREKWGLTDDEVEYLIILNDGRGADKPRSFKAIAKHIEENL